MSNSAASRTVSKPSKGSHSRKLRPPKRNWRKPKTWFYRQIVRKGTLPKARQMMLSSYKMLVPAKKSIAILYGIYLIGSLTFANGVANSTDLAAIKSLLDGLVGGFGGKLQITSLQLTYLFSGTGNSGSNAMAGTYQTILLVVSSLALLWIFRQSLAGKTVAVKQAFYHGMYPIVQVVLVLLVMALQFLPFAIGSYVFATFVSGGIAVGGIEQFIGFVLFALLTSWSLRMLSASLFALYIVTLPNMEPMQSLRSAKQLVAERRLMVLRKLLALFVVLLLVSTAVVSLFLLVSPVLAVWVFFAVSGTWFICVNAYVYTLYRELLNNE